MAVASKPIVVHQIQGAKVESIQNAQYATGQTFLNGEFLIYTAGELTVSGANPAAGTIAGIALQKAGSNPGYDAANSPATFTGRKQSVSFAIPNDNVIFAGELTNNSSTVIAPVLADIGASYGITAYAGIWTVDKNKTAANARVTIIGIDTVLNIVFFKVLQSFLVGA
jgi:hypothetical protein